MEYIGFKTSLGVQIAEELRHYDGFLSAYEDLSGEDMLKDTQMVDYIVLNHIDKLSKIEQSLAEMRLELDNVLLSNLVTHKKA